MALRCCKPTGQSRKQDFKLEDKARMPHASTSVFKGGCLCGAIPFTVVGPLLAVRACWCRVCQFMAAGNASIRSDDFNRDAVAQITERGYLVAEVSKRLGVGRYPLHA